MSLKSFDGEEASDNGIGNNRLKGVAFLFGELLKPVAVVDLATLLQKTSH